MKTNSLRALNRASTSTGSARYRTTIGILVFTFNHEKYIGDCISSIFSQEHRTFRVIVFDDNSTDSTLKVVEHYSKIYTGKIQILKSRENCGSVKQSFKDKVNLLNLDFDYFVVIEGDDLFGDASRLALQADQLDSQSDLIGVSSDCFLWNVRDESKSVIKPQLKKWNYHDTVEYAGKLNLYVHLSSIMWRLASKNKIFPKRYLRGRKVHGEVFFTLAMLRENTDKSIKHLDLHGSTYRYTGEGIWSSLSIEEQEDANSRLEKELETLKPFKLKVVTRFRRMSTRYISNT
jgi:glycosyltransferase involved in cell wall biosynthesis